MTSRRLIEETFPLKKSLKMLHTKKCAMLGISNLCTYGQHAAR